MSTPSFDRWPYPFWIGHRGAGKLAPENTMAAFRLGASHGFRAFECDVKLSQDGVPFLLHDDTLERTTNSRGTAGARPWVELARLDAGSWHGEQYAGEAMLTLETLARWIIANRLTVNLEIKPTTGLETETGTVVAREAARLWSVSDSKGSDSQAGLPAPSSDPSTHWNSPVPPLLTSFKPAALWSARQAAPELSRGLLIDHFREGWLDEARELNCVAVVVAHRLLDVPVIRSIHRYGMRVLSYTVNMPTDVARLQSAGVDGLITDEVARFDQNHHPL